MSRPSRDDFWFGLAAQYATRATCPRAQIGAILVKFDRLCGAGFNGARPGQPHCLERNQTLEQHMALDHCGWSVHAEKNALYNALIPADGATLYVVGPRPICPDCRDYLKSRGVEDIRHREDVSTLDSLAGAIWPWARATFPQATADSWSKHLLKEARELADEPTSGEEMADVFHLLVGLARVSGVDLVGEVARKFAINRARAWGHPDADGIVEHVREAIR